MLHFFKKSPKSILNKNDGDMKGSFSKCMLYAIGEIVLVVIGIMIAQQINIWNRKPRAGLPIGFKYFV
jgi:hypothetical protein